jgi:ubiquinone biosynthesis protein COQ9
MMAAKKSAKKAAPKKNPDAMSDDPLVAATLAEAAITGWRELTLDGVAARAGLPLGQVLLKAPTRAHLVLRIIDDIDRKMVTGVVNLDDADSPRDRLFDVLMRRYDILNQDRDGMRAVVTGLMRDPRAASFVVCRLRRSAAIILGAAGIGTDGPVGFLRVQGLGVIAASGLRAWLNDDTTDLAKTMAAVDRALARAERLMGLLRLRRKEADAAAA